MKLSNRQLEEIERLVSVTVRELVFTDHHAQHDDIDDAQNCLMTCYDNLQRVEEMLAAPDEAE